MMTEAVSTGPFTCEITLRRIRAPEFVREEKDGVTYLTAGDYELAYETTLQFDDGTQLPIKAKIIGELNRQVVIRDASGIPTQIRGWVQGRVQLLDEHEQTIFRGTYYDVNLVVTLAGDEALTRTAVQLEHWEHGFGEARYRGHAFSMRVEMIRESGALVGQGVGHIA